MVNQILQRSVPRSRHSRDRHSRHSRDTPETGIRDAEALRDNPQLINLRVAEKWDGTLPQVTGAGALPLLNLDAIKARPE